MAQSEAEQLAMYLGRIVASQLIGRTAATFITNPLLSALNIGNNGQALFQDRVLEELAGIRDQLRDMQTSLARMNTAVHQLQQSLNAFAISSALRSYYTSAGRINSRYRFFVNNVAALADPRGNHAAAANDLWVRLGPGKDSQVSDAMDEIHAFVLPHAGVQGLFDVVLTGMRDRMTAFAADGSNYQVESVAPLRIPSDGGLFATRAMLTGSFDAAREYLIQFAVPLMKHVLATQIKGLVLLSRAWAGGQHDGRILDYVDNVLRQISRMRVFFAEEAAPAAKQLAPVNLEKYGRRVRGNFGNGHSSVSWVHIPLDQTGLRRMTQRIQPFLNDEWVMWAMFPEFWNEWIAGTPIPPGEGDEWMKHSNSLLMVNKPWETGVRPARLIRANGTVAVTNLIHQQWQFLPRIGTGRNRNHTILSPPDFLKQTEVVNFLGEHIGEVALGSDQMVGVKADVFSDTPPAALAELVNTLPTKRDQLTA